MNFAFDEDQRSLADTVAAALADVPALTAADLTTEGSEAAWLTVADLGLFSLLIRIAHFNVALPSMVYYLRHHVEPHYSAEGFVQAMRSPGRVYGVVSARDFDGMRADLEGAACVLHRVPTFDVKLKNVLAREPLPELLLLSNKCERLP